MIFRILHFGEDQLRKLSDKVTTFDDSLKTLVSNMLETMHHAKGVGLAAPQVGVNIRLFVIEIEGSKPMVFVNPEIISSSGKEDFEEGCLSLPGLREIVKRPTSVTVKAWDLDGKPFEVNADGLLARAIQHENDHLEGILFVDRISKARKIQLKHDLERIKNGENLEEEEEDDEPVAATA